MEQHHSQHNQHQSHHDKHLTATESEVRTMVSYKNHLINIQIENTEGNDPPVLELTHEKLMHLVIVSEDLNEYYHLHPIKQDDLTFIQEIELKGHLYKAFVDIKLKGRNYMIEPNTIIVGSDSNQHQQINNTLEVDQQLTKSIQGKTVEFSHDPLETGKSIKLAFNVKNATPEPYLGALGHVVIIDEKVEHFIHVHPKSNHGTQFEAHFDKPGLYKLWAEFKFGQEVTVFPYVIEVK